MSQSTPPEPAQPGPARRPSHVDVLRDFANTVDVETGTEALATTSDLRQWLRHYELLDDTTTVGEPDLRRAHQLRTGLRDAMAQHHDQARPEPTAPPAPPVELDELAHRWAFRLAFTQPEPRLTPATAGVDAALTRILLAIVAAQSDGTWPRLKLCRASDCQWAFYDASKNRSRTWCAMGVCGNRQKTRTYRARRRQA